MIGGEPVALTDGRTAAWNPTWSRDGRTLFYVSNRAGSMDVWQQRIADDGRPVGDAAVLTPGLGVTSAMFSRDGTKLAYARGSRVPNVWRIPLCPHGAYGSALLVVFTFRVDAFDPVPHNPK